MSKKTAIDVAIDLDGNLEKIESELINTESDRACVIVGAALLDDLMEMLLRGYLPNQPPKSDGDKLFDSSAPLSTSSAKIELTYRLGLISKDEYRLIDMIRDIRNKFAHISSLGMFADNPGIQDKVHTLNINDKLWFRHKLEGKDAALSKITDSCKREFVKCVIWLADILKIRTLGSINSKPYAVAPFSNAVEVADAVCFSCICSLENKKTYIETLQSLLDQQILSKSKDSESKAAELRKRISKYEAYISIDEQRLLLFSDLKENLHKEMKEAGLLDDEE